MAKPTASADAGRCSPAQVSFQRALRGWAQRHLSSPPTPSRPVAVALSGGADSVALLMAAQLSWPGCVVALHVNHGLQVAAAEFQALCKTLCDAHQVHLISVPVVVPREAGASLEAEARHARYTALAQSARTCGAQAVLLGQHADDQAETVLLALTRGAGMPGLAGMGECGVKHGVVFGRPFLTLRAAAIRQWVTQLGVAFADDPSNLDQRHTRNRIRHSVLPGLALQFPSVVDTLSRTARHAAEAADLLQDLAVADLTALGNPPAIKGLQALSRSRQANALRHWLQVNAGAAPSTAQLDELLSQVARCTTRGHAIAIKVSLGRVHRLGDTLQYVSGL